MPTVREMHLHGYSHGGNLLALTVICMAVTHSYLQAVTHGSKATPRICMVATQSK